MMAADSLRALYNRYRPQRFSEVAGQRHVVRILQNALVHNRVSHAYLFSGERGTGKTTVGRILAKALNCQRGIQPEPCNDCQHCRSVGSESFLDLIEIDAASHTSVNDIRDLREKVRYRPAAGRFKIYLVDEVHQLSRSAYNAFLKTLEEPPEHVVFILATTDPHRVLPTVRSRCQHLRFKRIGHEQMVAQMQRVVQLEDAMADDLALALIARNAEGSLRDALGLLEQGLAYADNNLSERHMRDLLGTAGYEGVTAIAAAIASGQLGEAMGSLMRALDDGADPIALQGQLVGLFRAVLLLLTSRRQAQLDQYSGDELEALKAVSANFQRIRQPLAVVEALTERPPLTSARPPQLDLELAVAQAAIAAGANDSVAQIEAEVAVDPGPVQTPGDRRHEPSPEPERAEEPDPRPSTDLPGSAPGPATKTAAAVAPVPVTPVSDAQILELFNARRAKFDSQVRSWHPVYAGQLAQAAARAEGGSLILAVGQRFALNELQRSERFGELAEIVRQVLQAPVNLRLEAAEATSDHAYTARISQAAIDLFGAEKI